MDALTEALGAFVGDERPAPSAEEMRLRGAILMRLFEQFDAADADRCELYVAETEEIPVGFLAVAVVGIIRSRVYPSLPTVGDLWTAAKQAAGMHREQYHAGRYLPPPRTWPPDGQRYAVNAGELERIDTGRAVRSLAPGPQRKAIGA